MIIVIGSNPSNQSPDKTAFSVATRSGKTIRGWFFDVPDVIYMNVSDEPTANNRPLMPASKKGCSTRTCVNTYGRADTATLNFS